MGERPNAASKCAFVRGDRTHPGLAFEPMAA